MTRKKEPGRAQRFDGFIEELEPRLLFSADASALLPTDLNAVPDPNAAPHVQVMAQPPASDQQQRSTQEVQATTQVTATAKQTEIIFVDAHVQDAQKLITSIISQQDQQRTLEIHWLDQHTDGLAQITQVLQDRHDIAAVHIISHGQDGVLNLGATILNGDNLAEHAAELTSWNRALTADADLLIYGCDVAATAKGQHFIEDLSLLTGADVAASSDVTGATALGGDWDLEVSTGHIEAQVAPDARTQADWQGTLAVGASGSETLINTTTSGAQSTTTNRQVGVDSSGNYVVVWQDAGNIKYAMYNSSGTQTHAEATVAAGTTAQVAMNDSGAFVVTYLSSGDVKAQRYNAAGTAQGSAITVLADYTAASYEVFYVASTYPTMPSVAINNAGEFVVVYKYYVNQVWSTDYYEIDYKAYTAAGAQQGTNGSGVIYTGSGSTVVGAPSIAMNGSGAYIVAWEDGTSTIRAQRYTSARVATGASDFQVNVATGSARSGPSVAMDDSGNSVITWTSTQGGTSDIYSRRYNSAGTAQGTEALVHSSTTNNQTLSSVAMNRSTGAYTVAWQDSSGSNDIYLRDFASDGTASAVEQIVNTTTAGSQATPSIGRNGTYAVVAWTNPSTTTDVYAQRYGQANTAPVNTVPGAQSVNEDASLVFSSGNGNLISIYDADAGSSSVQVTISVSNGLLSLAGTTGLTFTAGDGTSDATMTFTGTVTAINTALATLTYVPTANYNGSDTLTVTTNDQGNTGSGGAKTDTDTVAITVNAVNDTPTNTVPGAQSVNEDTNLTFSSGNGNLISIADIDAASGSMQVTLSVLHGALTLSGTTGLTFSAGDGSADASMTFTGTTTDINTALAGLIYVGTANYNGADTLTLTTSDQGNTGSGGAKTDTDTVAITVSAVNDAPVNTVPAAQSTNEDTSLTFSTGNSNKISIADVDAASGNMQVTLSVAHGVLTLAGIAGLSFTAGDGTADATMTFTGTATAINTAIATLVYAPTANYNGADTLTITTSDQGNTGSGGTLTDTDTVAITVNAVNDAPINTVPSAQTVNEDSNLTFSSGTSNLISISDVDAASGNMQVTLTVLHGGLSLSGTTGLSFTAGDGTADSTMTFTGTATAINTALSGLVYLGSTDYNGADTLTITTSDLGNTGSGGTLTDTDTVGITVSAVNDAPVNNVPAAQSTNEDTSLVFSSGNGNQVSITDVDAASASMQVTVSVSHGALTLAGITGLSFTAGDGTADATMTFTGTRTAINTALATLTYAPTANYNGADTLTITTSDQGNTGSGGTKTDTDTVAITVNAVNDAPVNSVPSPQSTNEDTAITFSSGNGNLISIADVDAASGAMQVTVAVSHGLLTLSGTTGLSFTAGDGTLDATMTFTGTVSAINTALSGLIYAPSADYNGADTLTITTSDQGNTGSGGTLTDTDTVAITVNAVNDAPINNVPAAQTVNEDANLVFSSGNSNLISISDVDEASGSMQVTLSVSNGLLTLSGTTGLSFTAGDGTSDATMTFTGTASSINTALSGLLYVPTSNYNGADTLTITTSDQGNTGSGGVKTDTDTVAITVSAVNDAPINSVPTGQTLNEDSTLTFSSGNSNLISISDVDAASGSMQVTVSVGNGALTLSGTTGLTFSAGDGTLDATMTFTGSVSAVNTALAGLVYAPSANYNGSDTLTITTSDQGNTGSGGAKTDTDTVAITVNAVNDAPVNNVPSAQTTNEDTGITFSSGNGNLISVSDVDAASGTMQVSLSASHGTLTLSGTSGLTFSTGDGTSDATMTFTGTSTDINTALAGLIYGPTADYNGADTLSITTSDQGNTGSGGTLTDTDTVAITVNAVNDAPVNSVPAAQTVNEDTSLVFSSGNSNLIAISDVDAASGSMQVTLTVLQGALTLSGTSGLTFSAGDGTADATMTFTGTSAAINTALATLTYAPTSNYNGADTLTITTSDQGNTGSGGTLTDTDTVAITVSAVNDTPVNSVPAAQTVNEDTGLVFSSGTGNLISISDVDAASGNMQVTLSVAHGALTLSGTAGLTFSAGDGTLDATMTFTGTVSAINTALAGMGYLGTANYNGADTLTITTSDQGNTGSGGVQTDTDTVAITVSAVNDAPVNSVPAAQSVNEDTNLVFSAANSRLISISDVDAASSSVRVTLSAAHGTITLGSLTGLTFTAGDGTTDATMTFSGTVTAINAAMASVTYKGVSNYNGADTLTITTSDLGNTGSGGTLTDTDTVAITVNAVNDAPTNTKPGAQIINEDATLTFSTAAGTRVSIADVDAGSSTMQVTLSVAQGTITLASLTGLTFTAGDGTADAAMTFRGTSTNLNAAMNGMTYTPTANFNGSDTFNITTSDLGNTGSGGTKTAASTVAITINAVNDAPVATITPASYNATEQTILTLHGTGLSISDVDAASSTVSATLSVTSGVLTVAAGTTGVIVTGSGTNSVTLSGTLTQINNLLAGTNGGTATYILSSDSPPGSDTLTLLVSDLGNTGSGGTLTGSDTATINITAVNDAPTATISQGSYSVVEAQSLVLQNTGLSINDPDGTGTSVQVTLNASLGIISVAAGTTGVTVGGSGTGIVTLSGTVAQINNLLTGAGSATIGYLNNSGTPTASATFTLSIDDLGNTGGGSLTASANVTISVIPAASMGTLAIPGISKSDISAYYGFDATANLGRDDTGGGHTMTLTGGTSQVAAQDLRQSALAISAGGGEIVGLQTGSAMTIAAWVRFDSTGASGGDRVIDFGQTNSTGAGNIVISRLGQTDQLTFVIDYNGSQSICTSPAGAITNGQWLHFAATLGSDGAMKLYINGAEVGSTSGIALTSAVRDHNYIGQTNTAGTDGLDGRVNDVLIVNQVLSATQIATVYQQSTGMSVYEKSANGTVIGTVVDSSDVDGRTITYSLANDAGGRFAIDATTGVITVANSNSLLYASATSHVITVRGTDTGGQALDTDYTINLLNINDAPVGTAHTVTTLEDTAYTFSTADFGFTDPSEVAANALLAVKISALPASGTLTLNNVAVSANDVIAVADIVSGHLKFTPAADANGAGNDSFTFQVQDDGGTAHGGTDLDAVARTMTIDVTAVNDAPQGANNTVTTLEDTPYVFATSDFGFTDIDGSALLAVKITSIPAAGTLTLNGVAVSLNDLVLASDIASGLLELTPTANANGAAYTSFTFKVQDDGGTSNGGVDLDVSNRTMTLNVTAVNDAPSGADNTITTNEDTDHVFSASDFGFTDTTDSPAHHLQGVLFSILPTSGTLKLNGTAVLVGEVVSAADIASNLLTFSPDANANGAGYASIGFSVIDDGGTSNGGDNTEAAVHTLTMNVTAINDAPTTDNPSASGNEDTTITGAVTASDIDGDTLSYTKASNPTHGTATVAADGSFSYTPTANFNGSDSFTITVSDGHGGTTLSTVSITVNAVNDAPTTDSPAVSGNEDSTITGAITASDIEGDTLSYIKATDPAHGSASVAADGSFSYTPTANYNGSDSFTVTVSDGHGGTVTSTITITVAAINDAPVADNPAVSGAEDTAITGQVSATDVDGDGLSYSKATDPSHGVVNVAGNGSFTYTPAANYYGSDSFTVTVSDGNGGTTTSTVSLTVTPVQDAPTANNPNISGHEDAVLTGQVIGNDVDGDTLTYVKATDPAHGSVTVAADGSFTYTANQYYSGTDSFTIDVSDGQGGITTSTVSVLLTPVNDPPTANNANVNGAEDTVITGQVTATDIENDPLTFLAGSDPTHGSVLVNTDGTFSYTPTANYHGSDSFTVLVSDGQGGLSTATVSVTVTSVNDAPTANNASASGDEDTPITGTVTGGDIDGGILSFSKGTDPSHGGVIVNSDGSFTYTPSANYNGSDSFNVTVSDGQGGSATSLVSITIAPTNDAPTANSASNSGNEDTVITGTVTAGDIDGDTLSYSRTSNASHGNVTVNSDGTYSYTPTTNFHGTDSFSFTADDGHGGTSTATITITVDSVNDNPVASNANASGAEDTPITGMVTASDIDGDTLNFSKATDPAHGSVTVNSDGSFSYTPSVNYNGSDSFTVLVSDGNGGTGTATVSINVAPVNDAPTANNPAVSGAEDQAITGQVNGNDIEGDSLTFTKAGDPTHGSVTVASDGSFSYTPAANYHGSDSFTVLVSDGNGGTTTSTVTVTITSVNDSPVPVDASTSGNEDSTITGQVTASDVDGDSLLYSKASDPSHGSVTVNSDGSFSYAPAANYNGIDSFTVWVDDGNGGTGTATVNINVAPVNDAPVINNASASGNEDTVITGQVTASDIDGDNLSFSRASNPTHGSVTVATDGSFSYTPSANHNGSDSFTVLVSDGHGGTSTATVTITLAPINDAPTASDASTTGDEDTIITGQVTGIDVDGDSISYAKATDPTHGALTFNSDGSYSYTPDADFNGIDSFTVDESDGQGGTSTATVHITVAPVNDAPLMSSTLLSAQASPSTNWNSAVMLAQAQDTDGDALTVRIVQGPLHGRVTVQNDGQVVYITDMGYVGADSFTYQAYDGHAGSAAMGHVDVQASSPFMVLPSTPSSGSTATPDDGQTGASSPINKPDPADTPDQASPKPTEPTPEKNGNNKPDKGSGADAEGGDGDGNGGKGSTSSSLHEGIRGSTWLNKAARDAILVSHAGLGITPYQVVNSAAAALPTGGTSVMQLLELIKPNFELHNTDINLLITPLNVVAHALPAAADATTKGNASDMPTISLTRAASYSTGLGLSIGTIWWTARVSGLVTSALISTPAWRALDPLPVVTSPDGDDTDEDPDNMLGDKEVEHLFDADRPLEQDLPIIQ